VVIFLTGFPLAYYAARYNLDLDLITRGSGFGYYGSVVSNVIFATFTFIFFALEGLIMAQGLELGLGVPLWAGYTVSTLIIFPLVIYGMKVLSTLQLWTTPLWLILTVIPFVYLLVGHVESVASFFAYQGEDGAGAPSIGSVMLAAGVCLSLIAQTAEQIDYIRCMPPRTPENAGRWWRAVILAGPGWVIYGAIKQVIGLFLAVYIIANVTEGAAVANQPVHQFLEIYRDIMPAPVALGLAVVLVVISQVKINVTNACSGSLAWTNSFTRVTKRYPGRLVLLAFNLLIALVLMEADMFSFLNTILGFDANLGMAWVVAVASDITFNTYVFELSPRQAELRRGMLYAVDPVSFGTLLVAGGLSIVCFFGGLGADLQPFSPLVAIAPALVLPRAGPTTASRCPCTMTSATRRASCSTATSAGSATSVRTCAPARRTTPSSARCASARTGRASTCCRSRWRGPQAGDGAGRCVAPVDSAVGPLLTRGSRLDGA